MFAISLTETSLKSNCTVYGIILNICTRTLCVPLLMPKCCDTRDIAFLFLSEMIPSHPSCFRQFLMFIYVNNSFYITNIQGVPLPTKPGSSLIILLETHSDTYRHNFTTDTFLFISHTTNVLLFKSHCNIFIGFGIIKELPGLVGSGTLCRMNCLCLHKGNKN